MILYNVQNFFHPFRKQIIIGRLLNDPQLYNDMSDAAQRLTLTLRDLQTLVRKVKEEGLELKF
jgi:hypothetical protein